MSFEKVSKRTQFLQNLKINLNKYNSDILEELKEYPELSAGQLSKINISDKQYKYFFLKAS